MSAPTFPQFKDLPTELRLMIWEYSIPEMTVSAEALFQPSSPYYSLVNACAESARVAERYKTLFADLNYYRDTLYFDHRWEYEDTSSGLSSTGEVRRKVRDIIRLCPDLRQVQNLKIHASLCWQKGEEKLSNIIELFGDLKHVTIVLNYVSDEWYLNELRKVDLKPLTRAPPAICSNTQTLALNDFEAFFQMYRSSGHFKVRGLHKMGLRERILEAEMEGFMAVRTNKLLWLEKVLEAKFRGRAGTGKHFEMPKLSQKILCSTWLKEELHVWNNGHRDITDACLRLAENGI